MGNVQQTAEWKLERVRVKALVIELDALTGGAGKYGYTFDLDQAGAPCFVHLDDKIIGQGADQAAAIEDAIARARAAAHVAPAATTQNTCPTCGAAHITATDARVCCPVSAATLDALDQLPGAGYYAAERSRCRAWLAAGARQHDAAVAKVEALHASESSGCDCGGETSGPSVVFGVAVDGVHECRDASAVRGAA